MRTILLTTALLLMLSAAQPTMAAQASAEPAMSLEQAVTQVQQETGGKVLSASTVRRGRSSFEHRVKVLTPTGHIRVVTVTTEASKPASNDSTKNPSSDGESNKEKH
ncbi:PepSY domain-containing protein [Dyella sp. 20L07]|uniref:PepSY domain-containing protein n=1 Tax=Dyella sp. 20L07 TaxID=3384240 RepID=UPI003D280911